MPARDLHWSELKVGIVVAIAAVILVLVIFTVTGQSSFFTHKITLYNYLSDAGGMLPGAEVELEGVTIGNVTAVELAPAPPNPNFPVEVTMRVTTGHERWLRTNSQVELGTNGPLGEALVNITAGTLAFPPARNGTVLPAGPPGGVNELLVSSRDVIDKANDIMIRLGQVLDQVQKGQGAIGKLLYSEELYDRFNKLGANLDTLTDNLAAGQGTIGKLMTSDDTVNKANAALDSLNHLLEQAQSGNGTAARLLTNPALYDNTLQLVNSLKQTVAALNSGQGAMGALLADTPTSQHLKDAVDRLDALIAILQSGNGSAAKFINDPALYNNLNNMSVEMRSLLQAIRTNPRKYLTIHLNIF